MQPHDKPDGLNGAASRTVNLTVRCPTQPQAGSRPIARPRPTTQARPTQPLLPGPGAKRLTFPLLCSSPAPHLALPARTVSRGWRRLSHEQALGRRGGGSLSSAARTRSVDGKGRTGCDKVQQDSFRVFPPCSLAAKHNDTAGAWLPDHKAELSDDMLSTPRRS